MNEWIRPRWRSGGDDAFLFYAVFGEAPESFQIDAARYRSAGLPAGVELRLFHREKHDQYLRGFTEGYAWEVLAGRAPSVAEQILTAHACLVIVGSVPDPPALFYLRDSIGVATYLLDQGGVAVLDLQTLLWFAPDEWRARVFDPEEFIPLAHAVVLVSPEDEDGSRLWFHSRGMRKFGRPDISVHGITPEEAEVVGRLFNRMIEFQTRGGILSEGQVVSMPGLAWKGTAIHGGSVDDPDFNNKHVEIVRLSSG